MDEPALPPSQSSLTLEQLREMYPPLPHGLAALVHVVHTDQRIRGQVDQTPELSAQLLSETLPLRSEFHEKYGLALGASRDLLRYTLGHGIKHPEMVSGEGVLYAPAIRMMYRVGYLDGFGGQVSRVQDPGRWTQYILDLQWPAMPDAFPGGLDRLLGQVLLPPLRAGLIHGQAEQVLGSDAVALMDTIDERLQGESGDFTGPHDELLEYFDRKVLADLQSCCQQRPSPFNKAGYRYLEGRVREIRTRVAREAVLGYLDSRQAFLPPLDGALVLRKIATRLHQQSREGYTRVALLDQMQECQLLLSASGVLPGTAADLQQTSNEATSHRMPEEILQQDGRNLKFATAARTVLEQLAQPPAVGRLWGVSLRGLPRQEQESLERPFPLLAGPTSLENLEGKVNRLTRRLFEEKSTSGPEATPPDISSGPLGHLRHRCRQIQRVRELLAQNGHTLSRKTAASLMAADLADHLPALPAVSSSRQQARCQRLSELAASPPPEAPLTTHFQAQFWKRQQRQAARTFLEQADGSAYKLLCAEAEIAQSGPPRQAEQAERWQHTYRQEISRSQQVQDQMLLTARIHILEDALESRAHQEAQFQLGRYLPHLDREPYLCSDLAPRLAEGGVRLLGLAEKSTSRLLSDTPRFQERTCQKLGVELIDWILRELFLAHQMQAYR